MPSRRPEATLSQAETQPERTRSAASSGRARPDWIRTVLTVSGPTGEVAPFRAAAFGPNAIPWQLDLDHEEARLFAPMASGGAEARMLARQLREIIAARHDRILTHASGPGACPLDLHRLLPVPGHILQCGEDDPAAQAWLLSHWGTTHSLRSVRIRAEGADRRLRRKAEIVYEFWSADWTPWQAIARLRLNWPDLVFAVQPHYDNG